MVLRIDAMRLQAKLREHGEAIGFGPRWASVVAVVEGLFLVVSAVTVPFAGAWKGVLVTVSALVMLYQCRVAYLAWVRGYDAEQLYKELVDMDRTEKRSSIIAVKNGNQYLLFHDKGWDCDFFPYHATVENHDEDVRQLTEYLADGFEIQPADFTLTRVGTEESEKPSTEHGGEMRYYEYTLYRADVIHMPEAWKSERFHVDAKDCRWMTLEDMLADPRMASVNHDVITMVRDRI